MKAWGAHYRSCSQLISVDAIICEKAVHFLLLNNVQKIVLNVEKTCILSIYKYDYINDCFDGSDEDKLHFFFESYIFQRNDCVIMSTQQKLFCLFQCIQITTTLRV